MLKHLIDDLIIFFLIQKP